MVKPPSRWEMGVPSIVQKYLGWIVVIASKTLAGQFKSDTSHRVWKLVNFRWTNILMWEEANKAKENSGNQTTRCKTPLTTKMISSSNGRTCPWGSIGFDPRWDYFWSIWLSVKVVRFSTRGVAPYGLLNGTGVALNGSNLKTWVRIPPYLQIL
jgi:hypothetical protein